MSHYDVILIGGGVMACATAYYLRKMDQTVQVAVVERDPSYAQSSTVLSDGNTRIQFNLKENILISLYALEVLARFREEMAVGDSQPEISFRQQGNLFLTDEAGRDHALAGLALQQSLGCQVEWWDAAAVQARYPHLATDPIVGGTFGAQDGTMDPQAVLLAYKRKAIDLGASYVVGEVTDAVLEAGRVCGVRLADGTLLHSPVVVNSSGAWGTEIAQGIGIALPVQPIMRHVFHLETHVHLEKTAPLTVFPSGLYLIHEHGTSFTCGKSLDDDPVGYDFTFHRGIFIEHVWEDLVRYVPAFEQVKLVGGWTGLYDINTFDQNVLLGEWPLIPGFMLVNGFSGHGFQQCHAVGRYLAEVILQRTPSLDLSVFSPQRLLENAPVYENRHRIV